MMRSIGAVVAGFLFIFILSLGADAIVRAMAPNLFATTGGTSNIVILCLTTVYVGVFATVGCYLTARLAASHPMRHALILGGLGLALSLMEMTRAWGQAPAWYNIVNLVLVMPYAWLGGRLRENELATSGSMPSSNPARA